MKSSFTFFALFALLNFNNFSKPLEKWVVYYHKDAPLTEFESYQLVVLDSDHHPSIEGLRQDGKTVLGYISLGEVENNRSYFESVKNEGILLNENKDWPGSYFVDVRSSLWTKRVIEELIPNLLTKKFQGIFLDTLDNPSFLEEQDGVKYKGMTEAATALVKTIREHYPQIIIMLNRGYPLIPKVAGAIDMILGESVFADYNFETKTYARVGEELYKEQINILKNAQKLNPKLKIYTLDYWDPEDKSGIKKIYNEQRSNGFIPYVSTIDLQHIIPEPS